MHRGDFRLTPNQNLIVAGVERGARVFIDALVVRYGLDAHLRATPLSRDALACVALPTCPLAMAEAERYLPAFVRSVEERLAEHGLRELPLTAADHRLPERLRASVPGGDRADRQGAGSLQPVPGRRRARPATQRAVPRERRRADHSCGARRGSLAAFAAERQAEDKSVSEISSGASGLVIGPRIAPQRQ